MKPNAGRKLSRGLKAFTGFKEPIVPSSMEIEVKCIP